MTNPFEPSGQQNQQGAPQWPAFPGTSAPQAPGSADQTPAGSAGQGPEEPKKYPFEAFPPTPPSGNPQQSPFGEQQPQQSQFGQQQPAFGEQQPPFGGVQQPQFGQPQPPQQFGQPGYTPGMAMPMAPQGPQKPNIVGIIAMVAAVVGTALACFKLTMGFGWILLPLAFILGIVALFLKNTGKVAAIIAILLSIVGTIVAACMFIYVVSKDVVDSYTGGETVVSNGSGASGGAAKGGTKGEGSSREKPLPIGSTIQNDDWEITVNSVDLNADSKLKAHSKYNDAAADGNVQILVNMTYKYKGSKSEGEHLFPRVDYVTASGNSISWSKKYLRVPEQFDVSQTLYNGASATGNIAFEVPKADVDKGTLAVTPGFTGEKKFFAVK